MPIHVHAGKLGFTHRTREELEQQLNEGLYPEYWYAWTNMGFPDEEDDESEDDFFAGEVFIPGEEVLRQQDEEELDDEMDYVF